MIAFLKSCNDKLITISDYLNKINIDKMGCGASASSQPTAAPV